MKPAPHAHQVRIREKATGRVFLAWPVDAREMLNHPMGGFEAVPADVPLGMPDAPVPASVPATPPTHRATLEAKSYKDLQGLAKRAGLNAGGKASDLVEALLPLVESGLVSLEELPKAAPDPTAFAVTLET